MLYPIHKTNNIIHTHTCRLEVRTTNVAHVSTSVKETSSDNTFLNRA